MRRISLIVGLLIALCINIGIYSETAKIYRDQSSGAGAICPGPGIPRQQKASTIGGSPFNGNGTVMIEECDHELPEGAKLLPSFLMGWQFYANWLIWAIPFSAVALIISNLHTRAKTTS